jgi:metallo-beta-lactamase family protein
VAPGIHAQWAEAGHILGSASIQITVEDEGVTRRAVFSGDLGPKGAPILRDYEPFHSADAVFLESTYGDRDHRPFRETVAEFIDIVRRVVEQRGKILVPTFAVGRAQLIVALLGWIFRNKHIDPFPIFLDSPMAIDALRIYAGHHELFDEQMTEFVRERPLREDLHTMRLCATSEQSRAINNRSGPFLVLAGSGMCNGGRILHHLKHNLWKPDTHVLIVGFQSEGSLGRRLVERDPFVTIHGERIALRAQIHTLNGFSAHAGQTDLLAWFDPIAASRPRLILTHGEDGPRRELAGKIRERHGIDAVLPALNDVIEC